MATKKPVTTNKAGKNIPAPRQQKAAPRAFIFTRQNYLLMIASFALMLLGFVLMYGKEDIYNATKTVVAPIVVMAGLMLGIYAIMYRGGDSPEEA